jgi:hypothetical protein
LGFTDWQKTNGDQVACVLKQKEDLLGELQGQEGLPDLLRIQTLKVEINSLLEQE